MIDLEFLQSLIRAIDESSLDSVEIERGGTKIRLAKTPAGSLQPVPYAAPAPGPAPQAVSPAPSGGGEAAASDESGESGGETAPADTSGLEEITSPMVGTFYRAPAPDAPPYVAVGARIKEGDTLCILEAMKLMNELEAEIGGEIVEICVENAEPVEYGQVLFRVRP